MKTSDVAMSVDEALDIAERAIKPLECTKVLAAEVRRLRAACLEPYHNPARNIIAELVGAMHKCQQDVDCYPPFNHRNMMLRAEQFLRAPTISCVPPEIIARVEAMQRRALDLKHDPINLVTCDGGPLVFINDVLQILRDE